ncbi:radical SAM family heme chaperone HemW [Fibrobacter sp. UWEL]|uniref:radical SAM family heme chaperone HemW n=1 Tax=Fibrobacter sp. UWEL TaxID=1896209 RepID=UPI00091048F8|nr:radical SAM family heme chaperone HemW [Fibrobacter sp. UWEL]SHK54023.1 oxygen-independent coproporphyrinogen-3 oxidase [Fibrobacter sp. UWEL]
MFSLYIHIPFCKKICDYCDFRVLPASDKLFQEYSDLVCREIELYEKKYPGTLKTAETLYLGGGTPSMLPSDCLGQIFACLQSVGVEVSRLREVSMEFNPESTSRETIENALELGVKRFSLGLQTFNQELLKRIGRSHSVEAGVDALELLLSYPDIRVSGDLMFSLPGQTLDVFLSDVDRLSDYPLTHISFYGLTVNPRTILGQKVQKGIFEIDEDLYEPMYQGGVELLDAKGFKRYEVSNFAKPGFESIHNQNYWRRGEYAGFGPGAHSYVGNRRFYAPEIYPRWRDYVRNGAPENLLTIDELSEEDVLMELFWLSLRQSSGLDLQELGKMGYKLPETALTKWLKHNYLQVEGSPEITGIRLRDRGWIFMDDIVTDLANQCSKLE